MNSIAGPLEKYWQQFVDYVPQLVGALVVLVVGLVVASVIASIVKKLLKLAEDNRQVTAFLKRWNLHLKVSTFVGAFVWWVIFLVFLSAAVQILEIQVLSETIDALVAYTPSLFAAAVVAAITFVGAHVLRGLVASALSGVGAKSSGFVSTAVYVAVLVFGLTIAASQLGIDTALITANVTVIVAGVVFAFALAFGLGGRETAGRIVEQMYQSSQKSSAKKRR